jgi:hypothetical protein
MNNNYQSLIFTKHGLERLRSRSITQQMVWQVISNPHKEHKEKNDKVKFIGTVDGRKLHVVAQKIEDGKKWLIISAWVRGENDQLPLAWRIISFPFWLVWKILQALWSAAFRRPRN